VEGCRELVQNEAHRGCVRRAVSQAHGGGEQCVGLNKVMAFLKKIIQIL
jgi:hypothetical protein